MTTPLDKAIEGVRAFQEDRKVALSSKPDKLLLFPNGDYAEIDQACREYFTKLVARVKETKGQVQYRILMGRGMLGNSRSFWKYLVKRGARHG